MDSRGGSEPPSRCVCATHPAAGLALNFIFEQNFKPSVGMRLDSRKIGVLITDGKSQDDIVVNSQNLRDSGIELYAIGESLILRPGTRDPPPPTRCSLTLTLTLTLTRRREERRRERAALHRL